MKKFVLLMLVTIMILSCMPLLVSCDSTRNDIQNQLTQETDEFSQSWLEGKKILGMEATNFSNGMAIVSSLDGQEENLYAIDEHGNLLYTLENYEFAYDNKQFVNGLLFIYDCKTNKVKLIDNTGKITTAEDLGGTYFVNLDDPVYGREYWFDMFEDGYIIVNKETNTFEGTTYETAIFNKELEVVINYSKVLSPIIYDAYGDIEYEGQLYFLGYLIWETCKSGKTVISVLDIKSNETQNFSEAQFENFFNELFDSMTLAEYLKYGYVEEKNFDQQVLDLSEIVGLDKYSTIDKVSYITENVFLAIFSEGYNDVFFTITDGEGNFNFEPIKYSNYNFFDARTARGSQIIATNNYVVTLDTIDKTYDNGYFSDLTEDLTTVTYKITTYDFNGNVISSTEYIRNVDDWYREDFYFSANDEAIIVADHDQITYYDFQLNIMCKN